MKNLLFIFTTALLAASCTPPAADNSAMMKEEANKAKMQRFYDEVMNAHNAGMADSFCTADFVDHTPSPGHTGKGKDDNMASFKEFFGAFPDLKFKTHFMIAHGDTVIAYTNLSGTNSGPMGPTMPATNRKVDVNGVDIVILKDGKATDRWGYTEEMKWAIQLGMMPDPAAKPDSTAKPAETKK